MRLVHDRKTNKRPEIPPVCGSPRQRRLPVKATGLDEEENEE